MRKAEEFLEENKLIALDVIHGSTRVQYDLVEILNEYANQRVIEELERLKASASGTPEHRVVWEWDLDDRIKELKQTL